MKKIFNKLIKSMIMNYKVLQNWWAPYLVKIGLIRETTLRFKNNLRYKLTPLNWREFLLVRGFIYRGYNVNRLNNEWILIINDIKLLIPKLELIWPVIVEPYEKIYPPLYFKGKRVLDIGAFIGDTPILFVKRYKAKQVIAYEPHPLYYSILTKNIKLNDVEDKVIPINKAIMDIRTKAHIEDAGSSSRIIPSKEGSITCETLNDALLTWNVNVVKMDCEGCEHKVIPTTSPRLLNNLEALIVEIHGKPNKIIQYIEGNTSLKLVSLVRHPALEYLKLSEEIYVTIFINKNKLNTKMT